jgi:SAM-dependent methyltransferase
MHITAPYGRLDECYASHVKSLDDALLADYDEYPRIEHAFQAALDESLNPRGPEVLYEIVASLRLPAGAHVLDVGCGEGKHSVELAERFDFVVRGIDPVPRHIELSNQRLEEAAEHKPELRRLVSFTSGTAEALPSDDASVDLIWCREVLVLVEALDEAFAECRRVLRAGGRMLIHDTFKTDRLEPRLAESFGADPQRITAVFGAAGFGADPQRIEAAFSAAAFEVEECIELGSEWGEFGQEQTGAAGRRLIHAARLLRDPERYVAKFGQPAYDIMLGDCIWHIYRMIGKLSGRVYLLKAPG